MKTAAPLLLICFFCAVAAFAGDKDKKNKTNEKDELYRKGEQAALAFDAIAARDAFCAAAKKDPEYKDAAAQCQKNTDAAQRALLRYKMDYAEGMSAMQKHDYDTAAMKFRLVTQGEFAEQAKAKLGALDQLKAQYSKQQSSELTETLNIGSTAGSFKYVCGQSADFDKAGANEQSTRAFFCAGWVRGASDLLRQQQAKSVVKTFCLPAEASVGDQTMALLKYITDTPKQSDKPTASALDAALRKTYPCGKKTIVAKKQ
jgi:hypothetical protein